jgi:hypothetical protein
MARHRYAHAVRPVGDDRQPARFIALAIETREVVNGREGKRRIRKLWRWSAETWSCEKGQPGRIRPLHGRNVSGLWERLLGALGIGGETWLVCSPAVQVCAVLGVWERLTEGSLVWGEGSGGLALLEDPPFAIDVRVPGRPGTLRIIDVRNYGVTPPNTADGIGSAIRSIVGTLSSREMGALQLTAGAQSWYSFRRKFLEHKILVHTRNRILPLERRGLAGGRCECYRLGRVAGAVYQVDFSSHYCSILRDCALPVRLRHYGDGPSDLLQREMSARRGILAECCITTEWPHLPHSRGGITIYPVGRFWTVLSGPDLYCALDAGEVVRIGQWSSYDMEYAFRDFATATLAIRSDGKLEGDDALAQWAKALGVSLVGKFAQRGYHWEDTGRFDPERGWWEKYIEHANGTHGMVRSLAGRIQRRVDHGETRESMPAVAAYVYAEGRRRLWEAQLAAGRDEVYYCVTDSLFVSRLGYERLQTSGLLGSGQPGALRLVQVHDWMEIYGLNHYCVPDKYVCAGSPQSGGIEVRPDGWTWLRRTVRQAIAEGHAPTAEEVLAHVERVAPYRHGMRQEDGRVSPWRIGYEPT